MCRAVPVAVGEPPAFEALGAASRNGSWLMVTPQSPAGVPLRCWLAQPQERPPRGGVLVLPEVFGVNAWVRSVAGRLAAEGYVALALPLFARTAPELELAYDEASLLEGRSHKQRTSSDTLVVDLAAAAAGLRPYLPDPAAGLGCVGFCFGGHVAFLAATLPAVAASCAFYGAGVAQGRPGGGPPSLGLLPAIAGRLLCCCGDADPLIPESDVLAIEAALDRANQLRAAASSSRPPHQLRRFTGAGHGFMCESRADFRSAAAAEGWRAMLGFFEESLLA